MDTEVTAPKKGRLTLFDLAHALGPAAPLTGKAVVRNCISIWIARNPLKSPESDEGIQENPSPFSWSGLVWLGVNLVQLGGIWREAFRETPSAGRARLPALYSKWQSRSPGGPEMAP